MLESHRGVSRWARVKLLKDLYGQVNVTHRPSEPYGQNVTATDVALTYTLRYRRLYVCGRRHPACASRGDSLVSPPRGARAAGGHADRRAVRSSSVASSPVGSCDSTRSTAPATT